MPDEGHTFEASRPAMLGLAYRMLGDLSRAEDMIQEAWLRWQNRRAEVDSTRAFLLTTVTRLCLDELGSARARREESRSDRLPEPVDLDESGIGRVDLLDRVSMAFLVVLQRLTPAERAVLLLHDVFDLSHSEIAARLHKSVDACRQLLRRARKNVAAEKRVFETPPDEHRRLLLAFAAALHRGDQGDMLKLLADDAVLVGDAGAGGTRYGRIRNVGRPVVGREKIAALMAAAARQKLPPAQFRERTLNGEPAIVAYREGRPVMAMLVATAEGRIRHVYLQADPERLRRLGALH